MQFGNGTQMDGRFMDLSTQRCVVLFIDRDEEGRADVAGGVVGVGLKSVGTFGDFGGIPSEGRGS